VNRFNAQDEVLIEPHASGPDLAALAAWLS
jgi:hypothetical protein